MWQRLLQWGPTLVQSWPRIRAAAVAAWQAFRDAPATPPPAPSPEQRTPPDPQP